MGSVQAGARHSALAGVLRAARCSGSGQRAHQPSSLIEFGKLNSQTFTHLDPLAGERFEAPPARSAVGKRAPITRVDKLPGLLI